LAEYVGVLLILALAVVLSGAMLALSLRLAPRRELAVKQEPFAGGGAVREAPRRRFAVRFYMLAVVFLVLDVGVVFLHPWGAVLRELGSLGLVGMGLFGVPLCVALAYAWGKGALRW
jgi:NADH-quinone oxidoreductase subunit A